MRLRMMLFGVWIAFTGGLMSAQITQGMTVTTIGPLGGIGIVGLGVHQLVLNQPFCAEIETTQNQTLADGNRINRKQVEHICRDSQGRTRLESKIEPESDSRIHRITFTTIYDPQANLAYTLNDRMKTAYKREMRIAAASGQVPARGNAPTRLPLKLGTSDGGPAWTQEDLGADTIEGFPVHGNRVTRTIPAGAMGNEQPMSIVTETWVSTDMKMTLREKRSDPRMGETVTEVTNIDRGEPDASLFQVPADYKIEDAPTPRLGGSFTTKQ